MKDIIKNTIAVDFDGVIHKYSKGWQDGSIYDEPFEGVQEALMTLKKSFWVYIFTTRDVQSVVNWMEIKFWGVGSEKGFKTIAMPEGTRFWQGERNGEVAVSNRKLPAEYYIDDRGIRFDGSWKIVLQQIEMYSNPPETP